MGGYATVRLEDLNSSLSWASKLRNQSVVYLLRWESKNYIGSSVNLSSRLYWWRANLKGVPTKVKVLLICSKEMRHFYEARAIGTFRTARIGHNKTADGKAGAVIGHQVSSSTRTKISKANSGKKRSNEVKLKMRAAKLGVKQSPAHVKARSAGLLGHVVTEETRGKISKSNKGRPKSESHRLALAEAWKIRRMRGPTK